MDGGMPLKDLATLRKVRIVNAKVQAMEDFADELEAYGMPYAKAIAREIRDRMAAAGAAIEREGS